MDGGHPPSILELPGTVIDDICNILDLPTEHNWMKLVEYLPGYMYKDIMEIRTQAHHGRSPSKELLIELNSQGFTIVELARVSRKAGIVTVVDIITTYCEDEGIQIDLKHDSKQARNWIGAKSCYERCNYPTELEPPMGGYRGYAKEPSTRSVCDDDLSTTRSSSYDPLPPPPPPPPPPPSYLSATDKKSHMYMQNGTSEHSPSDLDWRSTTCVKSVLNKSDAGTLSQLPSVPTNQHVSYASLDPPPTPAGLEEIKYEVLKEATNQFDESPGGHKVGAGGFGVVFQCFLVLKKKRVHAAVKVLLNKTDPNSSVTSAGSVDSVDRQQFSTEIQALSKLSHECLLPVLAYSCNGPQLCLVYTFMTNGSLDTHLPNETTLSPSRRIRIACDVASALHYLHSIAENTVVHRDIKSANILLSEDWRGRLGDFGLARSLPTFQDGSTLITTTIMGTHIYMAPEATRGTVTPKADVYAFGVLYELLTGKCALSKIVTESGEETDLVTYVQEFEDDLTDLLIGDWDMTIQMELWSLAEHCLKQRRRRPSSTEVYEKLKSL